MVRKEQMFCCQSSAMIVMLDSASGSRREVSLRQESGDSRNVPEMGVFGPGSDVWKPGSS